jgi:predicted GIY-YIG superfamily endonuclease
MENLNYSGIYFVILGYTTDKKEIIYIGESADIHERFSTHEKREEWFEKAKEDNGHLYFYAAPVEQEETRKNTEKALIYHFKPCCNDKDKDFFKGEETEITFYEKHKRLLISFTVKPTILQ